MAWLLRNTIPALAVLACCGSLAFAAGRDAETRKFCSGQKSSHEMAQDETRTISELCAVRDNDRR